MSIILKFEDIEFNTILAGLRCYQALLVGRKMTLEDFEDIATNCGQDRSMSAEEIDDLCEQINCSSVKLPDGPNVRKVCGDCGSIDVVADAYVEWIIEDQEWVVNNIFDKGAYCNACDRETTIEDEEIK